MIFDRKITCCFTGHRKLDSEFLPIIKEKTREEIITLIAQGYKQFICGGALGFDTIAEQIVCEMKKIYDIRLILAIPCHTQTKYWKTNDKIDHFTISKNADECIYVSRNYFKGCMQVRNRFMVDNSSICIAFMQEYKGGTKNTVKYAENEGVRVINIADSIKLSNDYYSSAGLGTDDEDYYDNLLSFGG